MKKFEVCIRGTNFLIKTDNKAKKNGFYAARFVEAKDTSTAVEIAMDSFRSELKDAVLNDKSDPPVMNVEEVEEVYYFQDSMVVGDKVLPGKGFVWDKEEPGRQASPAKGGWLNLMNRIWEKDIHVHTISVHFTNALYPVAVVFMLLFLLSGKVSFHQTYFYIMVLATLSVPFSYVTGIFEWRRRFKGAGIWSMLWSKDFFREDQVKVEIFFAKIRYGLVVFAIGGCCTLWHYISPGVLERGDILSAAYLLLNISILPPLVYLGHLGGIIVYEGID
jgi:uncharacterized membrane protein